MGSRANANLLYGFKIDSDEFKDEYWSEDDRYIETYLTNLAKERNLDLKELLKDVNIVEVSVYDESDYYIACKGFYTDWNEPAKLKKEDLEIPGFLEEELEFVCKRLGFKYQPPSWHLIAGYF